MNIQHHETNNNGNFFIEENGKRLAEMVYSLSNQKMVIEHTEVDEALRGKNIGYELVSKGVEYAREKGLKISPVCKFAKAVFDKKPEYQDVLAEE